jgi:hypothetical protein
VFGEFGTLLVEAEIGEGWVVEGVVVCGLLVLRFIDGVWGLMSDI